MCVPWELNPQPFALLTQYSTTEPQEHTYIFKYTNMFRCAVLLHQLCEMQHETKIDQGFCFLTHAIFFHCVKTLLVEIYFFPSTVQF